MTRLKLSNSVDEGKASEGLLRPDQVRRVELDALVDTGAITLAIPADVAAALGLRELERRPCRLANGAIYDAPVVTGLLIEILGRQMACDALVIPAGSAPLIGQIPLEGLDLVVDPRSREAKVNPESPDRARMDLRRAS